MYNNKKCSLGRDAINYLNDNKEKFDVSSEGPSLGS
jgi:hypothetical protein